MSDRKTRETDKIKFFEVGTEGEIRPAFPDPKTHQTEEVRVNSTASLILDQLDQIRPKVENLTSGDKGFTTEEASVLKKYLALREAEVEDLRESLKQYQEHFQKVTSDVALLTEKNHELARECESRRRAAEFAKSDLTKARGELEAKMVAMATEFEERQRAHIGIEHTLEDLERKKNEWKGAIAEDLRRIRLKEKEIETKHEMLKRDSQVLLDSKDRQLLDLKRKCDALELEMETMEERVRTLSTQLTNVDARKKRLLETLKLAMSLIEGIEKSE
ncbi:MAG: hypothetical protein HYR96_06220 [Deltaproteobacteria bacterium]|nr:hypothetical protein [Deltaproteobacteria bacterium]MBI3296428.1 hypothetical protein [Deltaproteobacteria bacterium]